MSENAPQQFFVKIADIRDRHAFFDLYEIDEPLGEIAHRHDEIGNTGGDGTARHRGIFGFLGILNQDDAAGFLDGANADRAIRPCAAQDNGEAVAESLCK
jgi:hypothetical protein